jgi:hypothetical protein
MIDVTRVTRRRVYLLIAALGLVGMAVVGVLNTARGVNSAGRDRELHEFDWGNEYQLGLGATLNVIRVVAPFDAGLRRFSYYTGALSPGTGEPSAAPKRIIAEGAYGTVSVRLRAFDPYTRGRAGDEAAEIARSVSLVTTRVWPGEPTPVQVDVHFMPDAAPFSQAKRVDWREMDAYAIAVFERERSFSSSTAVHELYHAFAGRWSLGTKDPANNARPNAAHAYEEVTAELFAQCGRLLANGSISRDARNDTVVIDDQRFEGALDDEERARAIELLGRDVPGSHLLRNALVGTVLEEVSGGKDVITLESPQGERLLARCRESAANPMLLEFRLANLLAGTVSQPEQRSVDD